VGLEPASKNTGSDDSHCISGTPGGTLAPDSDRYNAFCDLLTASGLTGPQLRLIDDALRKTGLQITEVTEVPYRPGNRP